MPCNWNIGGYYRPTLNVHIYIFIRDGDPFCAFPAHLHLQIHMPCNCDFEGACYCRPDVIGSLDSRASRSNCLFCFYGSAPIVEGGGGHWRNLCGQGRLVGVHGALTVVTVEGR